MKNKGFTMIEILAVFTITAIILLVVVPFVTSSLKDGDKKAKESFLNDLYIATEAYIQDDDLFVTENTTTVTIKELLESGYLKTTLVNPDNKKKLSDAENLNKVVIIYKDEENILQYKFELKGDKELFLNDLYKATEEYVLKKSLTIEENKDTTITIKELLESGYLKTTLINFDNNKKISDAENLNKTVTVNKDNKNVLHFTF